MKKQINWSGVLAVVLFLGFTVVSVSLVHYSYAWADEYSEALKYAMRVIGFIGSIYLPAKFIWAIAEVRHDREIEDLISSYDALWFTTRHGVVRPDDEDYKEDE